MRAWLAMTIGVVFLFAILPNIYAQESISSPLKQLKSGVLPQDVKCKTSFLLVIKSSNGNPSCVRPATEQRLLAHGWIIPAKIEVTQLNHETANTTTTEIHQNLTPVSNTGSNAIGSMQLPLGISTPTVSSTKSGIKIISIEMSPNPLKVGDTPQFKITFQNISDKPVYHSVGCTASSLGLTISPSDKVMQIFPSKYPLCPNSNPPIYPNETGTNDAYLFTQDPNNPNKVPSISRGYYQIMKVGTLHVNLNLYLWNQKGDVDMSETIQFNVNVDGTNDATNATNQPSISRNLTNSTISQQQNLTDPNVIYKSYQEDRQGINVPQIPHVYFQPLPALKVNPIISSNKPNSIKILLIGMSPNPLKVGDIPEFTVTFENISDKPIYFWVGCPSNVGLAISPPDSVVESISGKERAPECISQYAKFNPTQIFTAQAWPEHERGFYQIMKSGTLNITLDFLIAKDSHNSFDLVETAQFNVSVTQ